MGKPVPNFLSNLLGLQAGDNDTLQTAGRAPLVQGLWIQQFWQGRQLHAMKYCSANSSLTAQSQLTLWFFDSTPLRIALCLLQGSAFSTVAPISKVCAVNIQPMSPWKVLEKPLASRNLTHVFSASNVAGILDPKDPKNLLEPTTCTINTESLRRSGDGFYIKSSRRMNPSHQ